MKDVQGNELEIGQKVGYSSRNTTDIYIGVVVRFTKLKVEVLSKNNYKTIKYPNQLVIIK